MSQWLYKHLARFAKFATICIKKCEKHPWRSAIFSKVAGTKIRWLRYLQEKNTFLHMIEMNHETVRRTGITCKKKFFKKISWVRHALDIERDLQLTKSRNIQTANLLKKLIPFLVSIKEKHKNKRKSGIKFIEIVIRIIFE